MKYLGLTNEIVNEIDSVIYYVTFQRATL